MKWYHLNEAGEVSGPVSDSTLAELHSIKQLAGNAQVCREGSEVWISVAEAIGITAPSSPTPTEGYDAVTFGCPHCNQSIAADSSTAGLATQCPACGGKIIIPTVTSKSSTSKGRWSKSSMVAALVVVILLAGAFMFFRPRNTSQTSDSPSQGTLESLGASPRKDAPENQGDPKTDFDLAGTPEAKTDSEEYLIKLKPAIKVAVKQEEIEGRPVNGYYIYFRKGEAKPFTGYAEDHQGEVLWRLMDGVVQESWERNAVFPLSLRHAIYRKPKQGESLRMDFKNDRGVVSVKVWTPTGERCRDTNVENGKGTEIGYGERVKGESVEMARPSSMTKYEYGEGTWGVHPLKIAEGRRRMSLPEKAEPPHSGSTNLMASEDFDMGFKAGAIGSNLPFTNREAYLKGRQFGEKAKSMPAYTQGYNQGKEHGIQKITRRSNPFNKISQKVEWLAWDHGYSIGNLEGQLSR